MRDNELWFDFARNFVNKLRADINGVIRFELYPENDLVIFKTDFKDFKFSYVVNGVQEVVMMGTSDDEVENFKRKYKAAILGAFFKSEERKRREKEGSFV